MPNLTLTHSGNMDITNAYIAGNSLKVDYNRNNTGAVTGFTFSPEEGTEFVCGETYTITAVPQFSGTVLTENFTVSGVDNAGVNRAAPATLRQGFDKNLTHYNLSVSGSGLTITSSSVTSTYATFQVEITSDEAAQITVQPGTGTPHTYHIDNISGGDTPDPGIVTASTINLVVPSAITDSGQATTTYSPNDAVVSFVYSSSDTSKATIDNTGAITVLDSGTVEFCVTDTVSNLTDCETVEVTKTIIPPEPEVITSLTLNVASEIVETGVALPVYGPAGRDTSFVFTSSDPSVATIDSAGTITVLENGQITFCVEDELSGLRDCKTVIVRKAVYIDYISLVVDDEIIMFGTASATYSPTGGTVSLVYSSSDPSIASIDASTGAITVHHSGSVIFCVRDIYTNLTDCKAVNVRGTDDMVQLVYNVTSTTNPTNIFSVHSCCGNHWSDFAKNIYYNGQEINYTESGKNYTFPETGEQSLYVEFRRFQMESGVYGLANCIFRDVTTLVKVVFPDNNMYQGTGNYTFINCTNLREAILPSFTEIDYAAFYGCTNLTSITIPNAEVIGETSFNHTGLVSVYGPKVKNINTWAFADTKLQEADFPVVETLGSYVFSASTISEFVLPETVTSLGHTFDGANNLDILWSYPLVPPSARMYAFSDSVNKYLIVPCQSLNDYKTASNWKFLSGKTICENNLLESMSVSVEGGSVTDSGQLIVSYTPSSATTLLEYSTSDASVAYVLSNGDIVAFKDGTVTLSCYDRLSKTTASTTISATSTYNKCYEITYNVTSTTKPTQIINYPNNNPIVVMYLEDGTIIGENVVYDNRTKYQNHTFQTTGSNKVFYYFVKNSMNVQAEATVFSGVTSITFVVLPGDIQKVEGFKDCTSLSGTIVIPSTTTSIGTSAFSQTNVSLWFEGSTPPSLTFTTGGKIYYVPDAYLSNYMTAWRQGGFQRRVATQSPANHSIAYYGYQNTDTEPSLPPIQYGDNYDTIPIVSKSFSNNTLTVELGRIPTTTSRGGEGIWNGLSSVVLPHTIETIGFITFKDSSDLVAITLPINLISIENNAFENCSSLQNINIPNGCQSIGNKCFTGCTAFTNITLPDSITSLGEGIFFGCTNLVSCNIPTGITTLEWGVFNRTNLSSITIPANITRIKSYVFYNCSNLKKIYAYPTTAPTVEQNTFNGIASNGTLYYNRSSVYDSWTSTNSYYLGYYGWGESYL